MIGPRVVEADASELHLARAVMSARPDARVGTTDESVSSTSLMRSAHTAARGTSTAMNVAIITASRIWVR